MSDLARLLERGEYRRCLEHASELLNTGGYDAEGEARIQAAICRCKMELTDYFDAVRAGRRAVDLAHEAHAADVLGFALLDLAWVLSKIRRYDESLSAFGRFLANLPLCTAARCMEGTGLRRMGETLLRAGYADEAVQRLLQAHHWFTRFGDEKSAWECQRAVMLVYLNQDLREEALVFLQAADRWLGDEVEDKGMLSTHVLDWAHYYLACGRYDESIAVAFQGLELAGADHTNQFRAHLTLARNALATKRPKDALNFALGARVSAIDGRLYEQEFEVSHLIFKLLREHGSSMITELEGDYRLCGVDIFHYVSERTIRHMKDEA